ncbi:MAG TPA: M55 family metallopeptidase [Ktedonobacterales bacterium]|nr:M55 family metallopeptidase [Ktedonobacterales bacterium]
MKVFISTDFEGVAGIVDWDQILANGRDYEMGRRLLINETNAVIDGAAEAGASEFVVNDSHSFMRNIPPAELHGRASYIAGKHKPLYMMEGLDRSFDAIFFIGYHGSIGASQAILSHSYNPRAVWEVKINGRVVGETALNALVAAHFGVPIVLVTGDQVTAREAREALPTVECVVVKESITRYAANNLHPEVACERLRAGAIHAIQNLASHKPPAFDQPVRVEVTFLTADMAESATWLRGVELVAGQTRTVSFEGSDMLALFRTFVTMIQLTRALVE